MTSITCSRCGADLAGGRFCRRCGQPAGAFDPGTVTEANTKLFESTPGRAAQTQYYDPAPTGPSYLSPGETRLPEASVSSDLTSQRRKRRRILLGSAIFVIAMISLAIFAGLMWSNIRSGPRAISAPEVPIPPGGQEIPQPPQPPQPATDQDHTDALLYPGAEITMEMKRGGEGSVRQMRTTDSFDKVVAWYVNKLKPTDNIRTPGRTAILRGSDMTAVINGADDETTILLKEGIDQ